jgi:ATP-dependent Clp protease ATP-binding subunit ClpA
VFERFTEKAIKSITLAQQESRRLGHNFVGSEQILLGLIGERTGIAAKTLKSAGVNLKDARGEVEKIIGRGSAVVADEFPFSPSGKHVLELSWGEARQLGYKHIGTEHLLLGLLREKEGVAVKVLEALGVDLSELRKSTIREIVRQGYSIPQRPDPAATPKQKSESQTQDSPYQIVRKYPKPDETHEETIVKMLFLSIYAVKQHATQVGRPDAVTILERIESELAKELEAIGFPEKQVETKETPAPDSPPEKSA